MTAQPSSQAEREDVALLPCPFCGDDRPLVGSTLDEGHYVFCRRDECLGGYAYTATEAEAIEGWNRRPDREHATPRSMPEEVVEAACERSWDASHRTLWRHLDVETRASWKVAIEAALIPGASA